MAHKLTFTDGKAEMAYRGELPWHGHGQVIEEGDSLDVIREKAGLTWSIQRSKVRYLGDREGTQVLEVPDRHVLMRSDTKAALGIVSDGYQVVQPKEVIEFFRDLIEVAGFQMGTAGSLQGGRKVWAMARIGDPENIIGDDLLRPYLMLATASDGSMQTTARNVTERVVCANTLRIAMSETGNAEVKVSHRTAFDAEVVKRQLGAAPTEFRKFIVQARRLAQTPMSQSKALETSLALFEEQKQDDYTKQSIGLRKVLALFQGGAKGIELDGCDGTAWGYLNAVTEYADHHVRAHSAESRVVSSQFGAGDTLKQTAARMLLTA